MNAKETSKKGGTFPLSLGLAGLVWLNVKNRFIREADTLLSNWLRRRRHETSSEKARLENHPMGDLIQPSRHFGVNIEFEK